MSHTAGAAPALGIGTAAQPVGALIPVAMMLVFALVTVLAAALSSDASGVAATVLFGAVLVAAWVAPIRATLLIVMFAGLAVDRPGDTDGQWASPLVTIGGLLFHNLNNVIGIEALKFSGVFFLLSMLLLVRGSRVMSGRARDTAGVVRPAAPVHWGIVVAAATIAVFVSLGWLGGGDIQMAKIQVQAFLQLLAAAYLFSISLRGPRDYRAAGTVIVAAACIKAIMALWVRLTVPSTYVDDVGGIAELEYATNHGDSLLFACAIAVLAGPLLYRPRKRHGQLLLITLPVILAGLMANDRRIGWVEVALVLIVLVGMNIRRVLTPRVARWGLALSPVLLAYVLTGWWSPARIFAPIHLVRSVVVETRTDGSLDRSTLYRDAENYNLVYTFRSNPLFGTGFGHPFGQIAQLDDISAGFREFAYLPHNSILGLWAFTGAVGFTGIFLPLVVALFLAARAHACATDSAQAIAATAAIGAIGAWVLHAWGDIGFTEPSAIFLVGLAVAVAGQISSDTGAWPVRWRRRSRLQGSGYAD